MNRTLPLVALAALACAAPKPPPPPPPPPVARVELAPPPAAPGIDPAIVQRAVDPCADFYQFACGGWLEKTPIPADRSSWVRSFSVMEEENKAKLRAILEAGAAGQVDPEDRYGQPVADLYAACMDEPAIEKAGLKPLQAEWKKLDAVKDTASLSAAVGRLHAMGRLRAEGPLQAEGSGVLFDLSSVQDARDSTLVIGSISQGGLSLPDRDYYTKTDEKSAAIRKAFVAHVEAQLRAAGLPAARAGREARAILALETAMAESHWTRVELRDPQRIYNRLELAGLKKAAPRFAWDSYLKALGAPGLTTFTASTPRALEKLDALLKSTPPATWQAYLRWHLLSDAAGARALPKALSEADFWFEARNFSGSKAMPERWKHCVELTDSLMGEALGQAFVRRHFGEQAKAKALSLVGGVQQAMGRRIDGLAWMDDATRAKAHEKLAAVDNKIGFPSAWRSYDGLSIRRGDFLGSASAASAFEVKRQLAKVGKPLDRTEWSMTPPEVNAYYEPAMNEMAFPAGILQPPFYTQGANDAVNYGAIGLVVGHELTHGFDDEGRQYDARGNLVDWWSKPVSEEFDRRAACVERQYSGYTAIDEVKLDGKLTLGENLADLGGLKLAWSAYRASRQGKPEEAPVGGFSADQQFFLAHAQAWCAQVRPEKARLRAATDPHSSERWRVNGPLSNLGEFAAAFQCGAGAPMVRAERCDIW